MKKDIVKVQALAGHRLRIQFEDGVEGEVDESRLSAFEGVFAPIEDPVEFARARVDAELGTVVWPNGATLDPFVLFAELTSTHSKLEELPVLLGSLPRLSEEEAEEFAQDLQRAREEQSRSDPADPWHRPGSGAT
jgi:hypothetical protein